MTNQANYRTSHIYTKTDKIIWVEWVRMLENWEHYHMTLLFQITENTIQKILHNTYYIETWTGYQWLDISGMHFFQMKIYFHEIHLINNH